MTRIAAISSMPWPRKESWKTCAVPWKPVVTVTGRLASRSVCWMRSTASPSETPGGRLNEIGILQRVLVLSLGEAAADLDVLDRLEIGVDARDDRHGRP